MGDLSDSLRRAAEEDEALRDRIQGYVQALERFQEHPESANALAGLARMEASLGEWLVGQLTGVSPEQQRAGKRRCRGIGEYAPVSRACGWPA
jgi:hypothetical protein